MPNLGIVAPQPPPDWEPPSDRRWIDRRWRTDADCIAVVPPGATPAPHLPVLPNTDVPWIVPWLPRLDFPLETAIARPQAAIAYIAAAAAVAPFPEAPSLWQLATLPELAWYSGTPTPESTPDRLRVLALVPHWHCEPWLEQCLRSLLGQTQPLDGILVLDDASPQPPTAIVQQFPGVQLWQAERRVGPYGLVQAAIAQTDYEAYLFQDADDWSACDRLAHLHPLMQQTGAGLVGTQELRVFGNERRIAPVCYPLHVNAALKEKPGHPLIHPGSLVRRDLVVKLGGFATGLRFGGDTEFLLRAAFANRILNTAAFTYLRRKRPGSLTTDPRTGLDSGDRRQLLHQLKTRAYANTDAVLEGRSPDLAPLRLAPPVSFRQILP